MKRMSLIFIVIAMLIAGGLGWLTVNTLREEEARRLSAQHAEQSEKERLALWRLDGRVYLPLGLEGYRKYEDYISLYSPPNDTSQYLSPLVAVELPDWMSLHVQFDPKFGWQSPQVLNEQTTKLIRSTELEFDLVNVTDDRKKRLRDVIDRLPIPTTVSQLKRFDVPSDLSSPIIVASNPSQLQNFNNTYDNGIGQGGGGRGGLPPYQGNTGNLANGPSMQQTQGAQPPPPGVAQNLNNESQNPEQSNRINSFSRTVQDAKGGARSPGALKIDPNDNKNPTKDKATDAYRKMAFNASPISVHLGPMRPLWLLDSKHTPMLFVFRLAQLEKQIVYQGIWLDWDKLKQEMLDEVKEDFPNADLTPILKPDDAKPQHQQLTALPVAFDPGPLPTLPPAGWTPLRIGLLLAWLAAIVALSAAWLVGSSLVALSERRMRFVSAVTHELRTPLTSLRLYLDMLTSGMITEETKKQEYLTTLTHESERLNQLIENVLDFAKLEKRSANVVLQPVVVDEFLGQIRETWSGRLAADGKQLEIVSTTPVGQSIKTDPRVVQQVLGNLIDNARKYSVGASDHRIWLWVKAHGTKILFEVEDRGPGIPLLEQKSIFHPFSRGQSSEATGGAGLGLALAKQWAETLGGSVKYRPADGAPGAIFSLELST